MRLGKQVDDRDCTQDPKPDETISCYDECRTAHWETYKWQPVKVLFIDRIISFSFIDILP